MVSQSPSTPSEGEIVESDSEKATKSPRLMYGNNVDRQSRICVSVSRSPSPYLSPRRHQSRTPSRSPYREVRGGKRRREDDHYSNRVRPDHSRLGNRNDDSPPARERISRNLYNDLDRSREVDSNLRYDDRAHPRQARDRRPRPRTRSRSPFRRQPIGLDRDSYRRLGKDDRAKPHGRHDRGNKGHVERNGKRPKGQSVSDRVERHGATIPGHRHIENPFDQTHHTFTPIQTDVKPVDG
jgi:serine/threonine-protein kinase PRP4